LEVLTRSRLYTSVSSPTNPSYHTIISAIKVLPAVTINSFHRSILGKALFWVRTWISKPANWRKLFLGGAKLIASALPGTPVAVGAATALRALN
jgi:hypothetical protein